MIESGKPLEFEQQSKKAKLNSFLSSLEGSIEKGPQYNKLKNFNRIVISGSSLSGKSTIASIFRNHELNGKNFDVVHRYTTRPSRKGKNQSAENSNISNDFFSHLKDEEYLIYWQREMEKRGKDQRTVMYGFHSDEIVQTLREMDGNTKDLDTTYVYSANNDFVRRMQDNVNSNVQQFSENSLILYIEAPEETRKERMAKREDNMLTNRPEEAEYRLADNGNDVKEQAHLIVNNFGDNENETIKNIKLLIKTLFSNDT